LFSAIIVRKVSDSEQAKKENRLYKRQVALNVLLFNGTKFSDNSLVEAMFFVE
jgi:hypothetical protein